MTWGYPLIAYYFIFIAEGVNLWSAGFGTALRWLSVWNGDGLAVCSALQTKMCLHLPWRSHLPNLNARETRIVLFTPPKTAFKITASEHWVRNLFPSKMLWYTSPSFLRKSTAFESFKRRANTEYESEVQVLSLSTWGHNPRFQHCSTVSINLNMCGRLWVSLDESVVLGCC